MSGKKIIFWVLAILIAVAIIFALVKKLIETPKETPKEPVVAAGIQKTEVDHSKLPDKFPADIPIEQGATVTQNYNSTIGDGLFQATRVFETKKSLAENFKLYQDVLTKNGYIIGVNDTVDQPSAKAISARKGNTQVQITIEENQVSHIRTINISVTIGSSSPAK